MTIGCRGSTRRAVRPSRLLRVGLLCALAVGLSACGVPLDSLAHPIPTDQVYAPGPQSTPTGGSLAKLLLYFVDNNRLVAVHRSVYVYASLETTANALLLDLDNGPLKSEGSGLVTLLNPGLTCTYNPQDHIITVKLDTQFLSSLFGPSLYNAYGQIVLTLMLNSQLSSVAGVQFESDGALTYAYLPTETATRAPVKAANYESLIAPHRS